MEWFVWNDQNYTRYFDRIMIKNDSYVSEITPVEMYHHIYHKEGREIADIIYSSVTNYLNVASIDQDIIKHAAVFRSEMLGKKHSLSYGDCINYCISDKLRVKLLTGDEDLKGLPNVEFVK